MLLSSPHAMNRGLQRGRCCPKDHIPSSWTAYKCCPVQRRALSWLQGDRGLSHCWRQPTLAPAQLPVHCREQGASSCVPRGASSCGGIALRARLPSWRAVGTLLRLPSWTAPCRCVLLILQVCQSTSMLLRVHDLSTYGCLCCDSCTITGRRQSHNSDHQKTASCRFDRGVILQTAQRGVQDTA